MYYQYQCYNRNGEWSVYEIFTNDNILLHTEDKFKAEAFVQYLNDFRLSPEEALETEYIILTGAYIHTEPPQEYYRIINVRKIIEDTKGVFEDKEEAKKVCDILNKKCKKERTDGN